MSGMPCGVAESVGVAADPERAVLVSRPTVVELVGPAAAGKTLLYRALALRAALGPRRLSVRLVHCLPVAPALTPILAGVHRPYRGLLRKELKRMLYVRALHRRVERSAKDRPIILDEGAVYMLARLRVFGGERLESHAFGRWWDAAVQDWAGALTLIIRLDAADAVLINRLRARAQPHPVRGLGDDEIGRFIAAYRGAFDEVIAALRAAPGAPELLTFRTDEEPVDRIAETVAPYLEPPRW